MNHQLAFLLDAIDRKRQLSIREFEKTDLYRSMSIEDLTQWYAQLSAIARNNPPEKAVDALLIFEKNSYIVNVEYRYLDSPNLEKDPSFEVHFLPGNLPPKQITLS